jgi:Protein of unknown function (DUF3667)
MDVGDHNHLPSPAQIPVSACANCGAQLSGHYCSACGQKAGSPAHSVGHFLWEAIESLTHADSRVRNTLVPLLRRPGFLTREFFAGRRARYVPPLRLYLILSVVFFVLSALLNSGPAGHVNDKNVKPVQAADCAKLQTDLKWRGVSLLPRLKAACTTIAADNGRQFNETLVRNLGRAMFVFLPLMAALMKLLYWHPRRYYLEHLVLLIHNHACVFLLFSIYMLLTHWLRVDSVKGLLTVALLWLVPRYLYRSMKVAYGQSGLLTFLKFDVLAVAYVVCGAIMVIATAFLSVATLQ